MPNSRPRLSPVSLLVVLAALAGAVAPPVVAEVSGSARIFDGDTIEIGTLRIRIHGIDAPERDQDCAAGDGGTWRCGTEAASRLTQLLRLGDPVCEGRERDQYGRLIATCRVGETDLGAQLVSEGLAWAYRRYSKDYVDLEDAARESGIGIWQAETQTAAEYRADAWRAASGNAEARDCPIKGNITADGERIYHMPWSAWYTRTRINESRGEAWFCDESEAQAAGWRPAGGHAVNPAGQ